MAQLSAVSVSRRRIHLLAAGAEHHHVRGDSSATTPGFELTPSATSLTVEQGDTATDTIAVTDVERIHRQRNSCRIRPAERGHRFVQHQPHPRQQGAHADGQQHGHHRGLATITINGTSGSTTATNSIAVTITAGPGSSSITAGSAYTLINKASGLCAINSSNTLEQSACGAGASEEWVFTADATFSGYYQVAPYSTPS